MYQAHFKLDKRLFEEGVAADAAVFRSRQHDQLIEQFKLALSSSTSVVLLRGPAGVGKSTLTSTALRATSTRLALAWLNSTPSNAAELLELMLADFGVNAARASRIERLQLWRQFQAEMAATESRLFIVVERTEDLPVEVLHTLDSLTAADAAGHPGANVVLLGHHGLEAHLAAPVLDSFRQRIRLRAELKPFSEGELQEYLRHQVACAGGHFDRLFAPGTVASLQRYSRGVARLCNNLCETALTIAATRTQSLLTPQIVTEAAVEWLGLGEAPAPAAQAPPPPSAAIAVSSAPVQVPAAPTIAITTSAITPARVAAPTPVAPTTPAPVQAAPVVAPVPTAQPIARTTVVAPPPFVASPPPAAAAPTAVRAPQPPPAAKPAVAVAPPTPAPVPPPALEIEFDGAETDVTDVAIVDFPVLTDAIEDPEPSAAKRPTAPPPAAPAVATNVPPAPIVSRPAPNPAPAPPRAAPAAPPSPPKRVEPAYVAPKGPPPVVKPPPPAPPAATAPAARPATPPPSKPVAPPPAAASAPPPPRPAPVPIQDEDDLARQTLTMRAISEAKSIDDVSDSMAETLFGDAELDLMSAALATAASMADEDEAAASAPPRAAAPPAPKPAPAAKSAPAAKPAPVTKPASTKPASSDDDLIELLGLSDAPLELIDDSAQSPADKQKSASRR